MFTFVVETAVVSSRLAFVQHLAAAGTSAATAIAAATAAAATEQWQRQQH